jgi:hypothetical protein
MFAVRGDTSFTQEQGQEPMGQPGNTFWQNLPIPYQEEDTSLDFINVVDAVQFIGKYPSEIARYASRAEELELAIGNADAVKGAAERKLARLRRTILAFHFVDYKSSFTEKATEAFIERVASPEQKEEMIGLFDEVEAALGIIDDSRPRLAGVRGRLKALDQKFRACEQYINYEKFAGRGRENSRGRA